MKILVRAPNWIGDQILAYPFFYFLRRAYPKARISVACVSWVESVQFRDLINEVFVLSKATTTKLGDRFEAIEEGAKRLKKAGPWDLAITLPNSLSSAWGLFRSGASRRRGYAADGRGFLLNESIRMPDESDRSLIVHRAQAYLDLLPADARPALAARDFWGKPAENDLDPAIPGVVDRFYPEKSWPGVELVDPPEGPYWVLAPGSNAESRRWPAENFAQFARLVADQKGWTGVVVGGPSEAVIAEELCEDRSLKLIDRTARGPVSGLSKIFSGAKFSLCNDSGLAHVAAICGSPVQVVWGAGDPQRTRPIGPNKIRILFSPIECWPCERNTCSLQPGRQFECLRSIGVETLWKEITDALKP
jgi:heptosyltransferase-2